MKISIKILYFEFGNKEAIRTFEAGGVNYHKWPNARDGQNYVLYMTTGSSTWMADVTTGETWNILKPRGRSNIVNGFDYVKDPLKKVLAK